MGIRLGKDAKLYYGAAGTALASMSTILTGVANVELKVSKGEANVTTRGNNGWEQTLGTLKKAEITFEMPLDPTDAGYIAVRAAFMGDTQISLCALTGSKSVAGNEGLDGDFDITGFERSEPIDGEQKVSVTAKLYTFRQWVTVGGASMLAFTTQPSATTVTNVEFAQQPVVTIQDGAGATITTGADATATVVLALTTGAGVLTGTVSVAAEAGVATFTGLKVVGAGTGCVLTAVATLAGCGTVTKNSIAFAITAA